MKNKIYVKQSYRSADGSIHNGNVGQYGTIKATNADDIFYFDSYSPESTRIESFNTKTDSLNLKNLALRNIDFLKMNVTEFVDEVSGQLSTKIELDGMFIILVGIRAADLSSEVISHDDGEDNYVEIKGTSGNDHLIDNTDGEKLTQLIGEEGNDTLEGSHTHSNSVLVGGEGDDILTSYLSGSTLVGGAGNDTFNLDYSLDPAENDDINVVSDLENGESINIFGNNISNLTYEDQDLAFGIKGALVKFSVDGVQKAIFVINRTAKELQEKKFVNVHDAANNALKQDNSEESTDVVTKTSIQNLSIQDLVLSSDNFSIAQDSESLTLQNFGLQNYSLAQFTDLSVIDLQFEATTASQDF